MSETQVDPAEAADALRRLLDAVRRGELDAGSGMVARLEGALDALDALARRPKWPS